ncbi:MAG: hypothetical protein WC692_02625 [Erythrobacter sp.]|jgi:hypothetical protein
MTLRHTWIPPLPAALLALAACTTGSPATAPVASAPGPAQALPEHGGTDPQSDRAFAQQACGDCHAVVAPGLSPNPKSPPFADIANSPGLTDATLAIWLTDAHNYPEEMNFHLSQEQVDTIARHMLRLRDPNYEKPIY